jgi:hypothetical protein
VYVGDMFDVTTASIGGAVDAVWDRAALVGTMRVCLPATVVCPALRVSCSLLGRCVSYCVCVCVAIDPKDREQYGKLMSQLVTPGGRILLQVFEYDQSIRPGPPYR